MKKVCFQQGIRWIYIDIFPLSTPHSYPFSHQIPLLHNMIEVEDLEFRQRHDVFEVIFQDYRQVIIQSPTTSEYPESKNQ
jgi:hypothetical protein